MFNLYNLNMIMFFLSSIMFMMKYKHILINLINLEFMIINSISMLYLNFMMMKTNLYFLSFFLTISVCESVIGLSILIFLIQSKGNDFFNLINIMKW